MSCRYTVKCRHTGAVLFEHRRAKKAWTFAVRHVYGLHGVDAVTERYRVRTPADVIVLRDGELLPIDGPTLFERGQKRRAS